MLWQKKEFLVEAKNAHRGRVENESIIEEGSTLRNGFPSIEDTKQQLFLQSAESLKELTALRCAWQLS